MSVVLTEKAAGEVKKIMTEQMVKSGMFLRVGVAGGGCSGLQYSLVFDDKIDEKKDSKFDYHGVTVVVEKKFDLQLDGTTLDFYDGLEKRGFTFNNPNSVRSCGCGNSFSV